MNVIAIKPKPAKRTPTAATAPVRSAAWRRKIARQRTTSYGIGAVALVLMGLSLSHLAAGVGALTHGNAWHAWAMATGIDLGFIGLELGQLSVTSENLRRSVARWASPTIIGTLLVSALMNAYAFASGAENLLVTMAACGLGISIPTLIYVLTRVSVAMWIDTQK